MIDLGRCWTRYLHSAGVVYILAWPVMSGILRLFPVDDA